MSALVYDLWIRQTVYADDESEGRPDEDSQASRSTAGADMSPDELAFVV